MIKIWKMKIFLLARPEFYFQPLFSRLIEKNG